MKTLTQTSDGTNDIFMDTSTHQLAMSEGVESYATILGDAVRNLEGEIQLDIEKGVPYMRTVFDNSNKIPVFMHYVRKTIKSFDFVKSIDGLKYVLSGRTIMIGAEVSTDNGKVVFTTSLSA